MPFEPIAVVGRGCVLPGALTPNALWAAVKEGRDLITAAPQGHWGLDHERILARPGRRRMAEQAVTDRGGYVTGFADTFDPTRCGVDPKEVAGLDPVFHWLLHVVNAALIEANLRASARRGAGLIVGNLCYPTRGTNDYAENIWGYASESSSARNRFAAGLPTHLTARWLGLGGECYALDAACASSLYALKNACDCLHEHRADVMVAAAVNRADDLFLHVGFSELQALSPSGQSRPFHRDADGLLAAEGAACVVLKRLRDAVHDGNEIFGVIRGIGISNDGRRHGFLAPDSDGQVAAMRAAYAVSGIDPNSVGFVECHATGTRTGDPAEVKSLAQVFAGATDLPVGSLKSNLGHLITAAGLGGLLKLLSVLSSGTRPATLHADVLHEALTDTPVRPVLALERWDSGTPRVGALDAFGFGGNNAHLVVEEWRPAQPSFVSSSVREFTPLPEVAVCGIGIVTGAGSGLAAFERHLLADKAERRTAVEKVTLPLARVKFPPADLRAGLAQQTLILQAALDAADMADLKSGPRTGILVGMNCDPEIARYALRWRGTARGDEEAAGAAEPLTASAVIGCMPNIPANRLNVQFDARAFGYSIASEELSGLAGLRLAARALARGEVDEVLVGAVEAVGDSIHAASAELLSAERCVPGDGAVALVLRRCDDRRVVDHGCLATVAVDPDGAIAQSSWNAAPHDPLNARLGHMHAAQGLMEVAAAVCAARRGVQISVHGPRPLAFVEASPRREDGTTGPARVSVQSFSGIRDTVDISRAPGQAALGHSEPQPFITCISAPDRAALREALALPPASHRSRRGEWPRIAIHAENAETFAARVAHARRALDQAQDPSGVGIHYRAKALGGELAFVFGGAAASYAGAGRPLFNAFPEVADKLVQVFPCLKGVGRKLYEETWRPTPINQLMTSVLLSQGHNVFARDLLSLVPNAVLGLSSGETNSLFSLAIWRDMETMFAEIEDSAMYGTHLTGRCTAAARHWGVDDDATAWRAVRLLAPVDTVRAALKNVTRAHITIITSPNDCVVAGAAEAVDAAIARLGNAQSIDLGLPMVVHCPELTPFAGAWRAIHSRRVYDAPSVRVYSNAGNAAYLPDRDAIADRLTRQASEPIDFTKTVQQAWNDGVRAFVEMGPRTVLSKAISATLGQREHLAVGLDDPASAAIDPVLAAAAALFVHGYIDSTLALSARLERGRYPQPAESAASQKVLTLPARLPPVPTPRRTAPRDNIYRLPPAPVLAPCADDLALEAVPKAAPEIRHVAAARADIVVNESPALRVYRDVVTSHRRYVAQQTELYRSYLRLIAAPGGDPRHHVPPTPKTLIIPITEAAPPLEAPEKTPIRLARRDLEALASAKVSDVLGPEFRWQDGYRRQVRLPEPPLLLVDRVTALEGPAGVLGRGRITTETDIPRDAWYLDRGRMPPGILIESGQADLLLISWQGIDFLNKGERVYRLLGCELTFHGGGMPKPGETLRFDIDVTGHAQTGAVRLFFFQYDCRIGERKVLSVRHGQAGFFTDRELSESGGVLWEGVDDTPDPQCRVDSAPCPSEHRQFSREAIGRYLAGDAFACFGPGFEMAAAHCSTPRPAAGRMRLIDEITAFDPSGGPWGRGYLRAIATVAPDAWFYAGHFKDDPCMPGTLMADAAVQAIAYYMAACGHTVDKDGWRFEPDTEVAFKFLCRGQVVPDRVHQLEYEVFVEEVIAGDAPVVQAALLCRCDGFKVFHCRRFRLRLVPDFPIAELVAVGDEATRDAFESAIPHYVRGNDGIRGDFAALLACAWGAPSDAFGPMYRCFDQGKKVPRLPGPPYHFITEVVSIDWKEEPGTAHPGGSIETIYRVPEDAWYFRDNGVPVMPLTALMEILLQPCGWIATYMGFALADTTFAFRNLDGNSALVHRLVTPGCGTIRTRTTLTHSATAGAVIIVFFRVESWIGDAPLMEMNTSFGFFSVDALQRQAGLPTDDADRARVSRKGNCHIDLTAGTVPLPGRAAIPTGMLRMIDEIIDFQPEGGANALGCIRGLQYVVPSRWYFKAHFYTDPVQPGSLGVDALLQLLQCFMRLKGLDAGLEAPQFEPIALDRPLTWKYRGQVLPRNRHVVTELEVTAIERADREVLAVARGSLWVDGMRIYQVDNLAMRVVAGKSPQEPERTESATADPTTVEAYVAAAKEAVGRREGCPPEQVRIAGAHAWLDHLPLHRFPLKAQGEGKAITVAADDPVLDVMSMRTQFRDVTGGPRTSLEDFYVALIRRFTSRIVAEDPKGLEAIRTGPVLFLGNHQTGVESSLFALTAKALFDYPVTVLAKREHRDTWMGTLIAHCETYPAISLPQPMLFFNRQNPLEMLELLKRLEETVTTRKMSILVHSEGTRALGAGIAVKRMSSVFLDFVKKFALPIVPVRFYGGLPTVVEPGAVRLDYPVGYGTQDIYLGRPILPASLTGSLLEQRNAVVTAINQTGPNLGVETPNPPNPAFGERVERLHIDRNIHKSIAALVIALDEDPDVTGPLRATTRAILTGAPVPGGDSEQNWLAKLAAIFRARYT